MSTTHAPGTVHTSRQHADHSHSVPLWGLFLALLALTAGEVLIYEWWKSTEHLVAGEKAYVFPKLVCVLLVLTLTLPKALIVLVWFMHLKFERALVVGLAIVPFGLVGVAVGPTLVDALVLKDHAYNQVKTITGRPPGGGHPAEHAGSEPGEAPHQGDAPALSPDETY